MGQTNTGSFLLQEVMERSECQGLSEPGSDGTDCPVRLGHSGKGREEFEDIYGTCELGNSTA